MLTFSLLFDGMILLVFFSAEVPATILCSNKETRRTPENNSTSIVNCILCLFESCFPIKFSVIYCLIFWSAGESFFVFSLV